MASNSQFLDTPQDGDKKLDPQFDSATLSSGDSKGVNMNSDPESDSATPPSGNSHDVVPQDVDNDSDDPPNPPPGNSHDVVPQDDDNDADDPPNNPQDPYPMNLLNFIQPDNYLIRFVQEFDYIEHKYPRARG